MKRIDSTRRTGRVARGAAQSATGWTAMAGLLLALSSAAQADLMPDQRGTLNIVGDGAFMVLSVPVSAFDGVDDEGDGGLSALEFRAHRGALAAAVADGARLLDERAPRPLQRIMMTPPIPDDDPLGSASHVVVMGRFALSRASGPLSFEIDLFGTAEHERTLSISAEREATDERGKLVLNPDRPAQGPFRTAVEI